MEAADLRRRLQSRGVRLRLDRPTKGRIPIEAEVRAIFVTVGNVLASNPPHSLQEITRS